jgi:hypothetical protein
MALGDAALGGSLTSRSDDPAWGIQIHAAERSPGVWVSRDALIEPGAELVAPVLIGVGAIVCAGARVGPRVCIGDRAVVEARTTLRDAIALAGTLIGEGLTLADSVIEPRGLVVPSTGELREVRDPLVLTARDRSVKAHFIVRAAALALALVLLPVVLVVLLAAHVLAAPHPAVSSSWRPFAGTMGALALLLEIARGTRALVGVSAWSEPWPSEASAALWQDAMSAPRGILTIDAALAPDSDAATRLRLRAWYAHSKSVRNDAKLLMRCLSALLRNRR